MVSKRLGTQAQVGPGMDSVPKNSVVENVSLELFDNSMNLDRVLNYVGIL
jgi:hypothetical protein